MYYLIEGFLEDDEEKVIAFSESEEVLKQRLEELIDIETAMYAEQDKAADQYILAYRQFSDNQKKFFEENLAGKLISFPDQKPTNQIENDNWRKIISENKGIALRNKTNCASYVTMMCKE